MAEPVRVFVSHSHQDNDYCRQYVAGLRARGCMVWYDEHNLGWGAPTHHRSGIAAEPTLCRHSESGLRGLPVGQHGDGRGHCLTACGEAHSIMFVVAARCDVPLLLRRWKRIEGPGEAPVSVAEAVAKTANIMGVPSNASIAVPLPAQQRSVLPPSARSASSASTADIIRTGGVIVVIGGGVAAIASLDGATVAALATTFAVIGGLGGLVIGAVIGAVIDYFVKSKRRREQRRQGRR